MEHRLGRPVSRITLNRWVDQTGERAMTPLQMSVALSPTWGGYLGVDGKAVFIKGIEHALLIAVDQTTQDVVHARLVKAETIEGFYRLVREAVVVAGYPLSGLIIDASSSFVIAHSHYLARLPLQLCRIHFCRNLDYEIAKAKRAPDAWLRAELKQRIRATLFASTYLEARHRLQTLLADAAHYQGLSRHDTLGQLQKRFELLMTHHHHPGLPPDSNITENVIKQLGKKLRLMEGFQTVETAQRFVRLLVACYRFKRFTDSGNGHNGTAHSNSPESTSPASTGSTTSNKTHPESNTQCDAPQIWRGRSRIRRNLASRARFPGLPDRTTYSAGATRQITRGPNDGPGERCGNA